MVAGKPPLQKSEWSFVDVPKGDAGKARAWEYGRAVIRCNEAKEAAAAAIQWQFEHPGSNWIEAPFADAMAEVSKDSFPFLIVATLEFIRAYARMNRKRFRTDQKSIVKAISEVIDLMPSWEQFRMESWWKALVDPMRKPLFADGGKPIVFAELLKDEGLHWSLGNPFIDDLRATLPLPRSLAGFINEYESMRDGLGKREHDIVYGCFAIDWDASPAEIEAEFSRWLKEGIRRRGEAWRNAARPDAKARRELAELGCLRCEDYYGRKQLSHWTRTCEAHELKMHTPVANLRTLGEYADAARMQVSAIKARLIPLWTFIATCR